MKRLKMAPLRGALLGLALLLAGAAVVAPATAHRGGEKHATNGFHHHDHDGKFFLRLTGGDTEPPPGGDPDASGVAKLVIDPDAGTVCVRIKWAGIDGVVTNSHIHVAPPGQAGPVVVPLFVNERFVGQRNRFAACVVVGDGPGDAAARQTLEAIIANPEDYYLNVHSTVFPAGAIRAQLTGDSHFGRGHHHGDHDDD
jgi:hypothetical protein